MELLMKSELRMHRQEDKLGYPLSKQQPLYMVWTGKEATTPGLQSKQSKRAKPELVSTPLSRRRLSHLRLEFRRNVLSLRGDRNRVDQRRIEMRFKFWSFSLEFACSH